MKSIILATAILSRLEPFMGDYPAALLEVDGKSVIDRLLADVDAMEEIDGHLIVTNDACYSYLKAWLLRTHYRKPITLIHDGQVCKQEKCNPMCEIVYVIERNSLQEELLVMNGNMVVDGSMMEFVRQARSRGCSCIPCYRESSLLALKEGAVVVFGTDMKVVAIHERPQVPPTRWGVASYIYLTAADVVRLYKEVASGTAFDSPVNMMAWLCTVSDLYAWVMPGAWFDIIDASSYEAADKLCKDTKGNNIRT